MKPIPAGVVEIRRSLCPECSSLAADPCAACIHGNWGQYVRCEPDLPPLAEMAANVVQAAGAEAGAILSGVPAVSDQEIAKRMDLCRACHPHFRQSDERCALCGCVARYKTRLRSQHCPIQKW